MTVAKSVGGAGAVPANLVDHEVDRPGQADPVELLQELDRVLGQDAQVNSHIAEPVSGVDEYLVSRVPVHIDVRESAARVVISIKDDVAILEIGAIDSIHVRKSIRFIPQRKAA